MSITPRESPFIISTLANTTSEQLACTRPHRQPKIGWFKNWRSRSLTRISLPKPTAIKRLLALLRSRRLLLELVWIVGLGIPLLVAPLVVLADVLLPIGSEFLVNTHTFWFQMSPSVATDADGDFVIAWQSVGQEASNFGIYAQRYNASGMKQGNEFLVNTFTPNSQDNPSVAMDDGGNFIITWQSYGQDGPLINVQIGVYAQRYNVNGVPQGNEFLVNTFTTGEQSAPSVAMDADGDFVIVWQSGDQDGSGYGVYAQRYNASGMPQGNEFLVNTFTTGEQSAPTVAASNDGAFVIAWHSDGQNGVRYGVYVRRFEASGIAENSEFRAHNRITGSQVVPNIAVASDGKVRVAWQSEIYSDASWDIYAARFISAFLPNKLYLPTVVKK